MTLARTPYARISPADIGQVDRELKKLEQMSAGLYVPKVLVAARSPYAVLATDTMLLCDCTAGAITLVFPLAARVDGMVVQVVKSDTTTNAVTLSGTFSGVVNPTVTVAHAGFTVFAMNGAYHITSLITDPIMPGETGVISIVYPYGDVRRYGAVGDGSHDDTAAVQAAVASLIAIGRRRLYFSADIYKITSSIDFGTQGGLRVVGEGRPGESSAVGLGATVIAYSGTGFCFQWAVGSGSALFQGITFERLHIKGSGTTPAGGIHIGNGSNFTIRDVVCSDFKNGTTTGTGFQIGDAGTTGAQYGSIINCSAFVCDTGIDAIDHNGLRIIGGTFEDQMPTPRAGTYGIRIRANSDTAIIQGAVVQGWSTLIELDGDGASCTGNRCEGFTTAYHIAGSKCGVFGGSINNFINGAGTVGTGFLIDNTALATFIAVPVVGAVLTKYTDNGSRTTIVADPDAITKIESVISLVQANNVIVNKQGAGAQDPTLTMESNGTAGPLLGTTGSFQTLVLDHQWTGATNVSLRLKGVEVIGFTPAAVTVAQPTTFTGQATFSNGLVLAAGKLITFGNGGKLGDVSGGGSTVGDVNVTSSHLLETKAQRVANFQTDGAGAQTPTICLKSNTTEGLVIGHDNSFNGAFFDHSFASATKLSLRVRGVEALAIGNGTTLGFYGATPGAKPTVTGSRGGNAGLASFLTAVATLGLIIDSTTP